ncbi:MAG TPA: DUF4279 domain-containing protein, partial [Bryobacteraceae bacterium]|nr:DUF4279 domain-containing protein [Bryobacteraceae bacterium]
MINEGQSGDHVTVGVTIESTALTPEQISQRVGIAWDWAKRIGDPRGHTGKQWDRNLWQIFEKKQGTVNNSAHDVLPVCVADVLQRLKPICHQLREIGAVEGAEFFIHVTSQSVPGISLSRETIRVLADAELSLDVDIIP